MRLQKIRYVLNTWKIRHKGKHVTWLSNGSMVTIYVLCHVPSTPVWFVAV